MRAAPMIRRQHLSLSGVLDSNWLGQPCDQHCNPERFGEWRQWQLLGVNVAAGVGNQQSNSLAIANQSF